MKTKKYLFLLSLLFCINYVVNSQEKIDSLSYYIDQVKKNAEPSILTKAYSVINEAKEISLDSKKNQMAAYYLDYLSRIEVKLGLSSNSEKSIVKGLELLDVLPNTEYNLTLRNGFVNRLSLIYWEYKDYDESLREFLKLSKFDLNEERVGVLFNNIGVTYKHLRRYDSAQFYLEKAYNINKSIKNKLEEARSLDNLGFVKGIKGLKEGEEDMMKALRIRDSIGKDLYTSYHHLTKFYKIKSNRPLAINYAQKAYDIATNDKSNSKRLDALRNLLEVGIIDYLFEYLELRDKISIERQKNENKFAKIKYDYKKEQVKVIEAKSQTRTFQGIAAFVVLLLISITLILRTRHRKNMLIKQFETEQRISKKLHDEVANDVFHNLTKMRRDPTISKELLVALDQVYDKVRDISKTHADLDVNTDFGRLLNDLILSYKTQGVNIFTKNISKIVWQEISETKKKVLYRVIQELMVNMKKHSQATLVTIKFVKERGKLTIEYIDNGVGGTFEKGSGLRNTESRMELVGGKISFTSELDKGFQANLIL